jgi:TRAP-type C4-dicarboxylate transport system permease small subunit
LTLPLTLVPKKIGGLGVNKIIKGWNWVETTLIGLLIFVATMISFYTVLTRYLFNYSPDWGEEVIIYLIIWGVFISASLLVEERGHVAATLLVERFPLRMRRFLAIFNAVLAFGFSLLIFFFGFKIVGEAFLRDERSLTALRFPVWIAYLSVVTGCVLVSIRYVIRIYRLLFLFDISQIMEEHERIIKEQNL